MDDLLALKGVGEVTLKKLNALNIYSYADLAFFAPRSYIDFDSALTPGTAQDGDFVLCELTISAISKPYRKGRLTIIRAYALCDTGAKIKITWYNNPYIFRSLSVGQRVRVYGKIKTDKAAEFINPIHEVCGDAVKLSGIRPIYAVNGQINQATMQKIIADALTKYQPISLIPPQIAADNNLMGLDEAIKACHNPDNISQANDANRRIALEELAKRIAAFRMIRQGEKRYNLYRPASIYGAEQRLGFALTPSQRDAVSQITGILQSTKPLNAMLAGDVGSGKTAVAMLASFFAVQSGYQVAVMAPTEILAAQHHINFCKVLEPLGVRIEMLCGCTQAAAKRCIKAGLVSGQTNIIIGTQALFSGGVQFANLGLAIIDEQHRFGVAQRTALVDKGKEVDMLTLSATPIPRSLRLGMFGEVDIIQLQRRHSASNINTAVVPPQKRQAMMDYIAKECQNGASAFVVAPLIDAEQEQAADSAEELFAELKAKYGKAVKIGLLHGKIKPTEKLAVIDAFARGAINILVSTTVIEVGVDVPGASIMAVFGAERFGLATLHQLRGRVGRDGKKAYCFLYTNKNPSEISRLTIMSQENDGLVIAEKDYELRGAGELLGESQSGRGYGGISLSVDTINLAARLAGTIDIKAHETLLQDYIRRFGLQRITLS